MLQQGLPVADVCYFMGEEQPSRALLRECLEPGLSAGYDYDCINRDALLTLAQARAGKLVLSDGVSYNLLVLPNSDRMTPEVAGKVGELAKAGVAVIGPKPERSYSLTDYPKCDRQLQRIVATSWGNVRDGVSPDKLLGDARLPADVEFIGVDMALVHRGEMEYSSLSFCWNHRKTDEADICFVSNQEREARSVEVAFRATGKQPELWHPETGEIRDLRD